jgi:outer membrane immunogenic protein
MKSRLLIATFVAAAGMFTVPAHAETFDGPYVGVQGGFNRAEVADRIQDGGAVDADISREAIVLGAYAGYNHKVGERFVLGAEAGVSAAFDDELRGLSAGNALTIDPRYSFDLTARAGYLVNDKTLVYLRGGYANTRVRTTLANDTGVVTTSDNLDGWIVGGGVERTLTDDISARLEYRYTDLGSDGGEFDQHQALVGISYNF